MYLFRVVVIVISFVAVVHPGQSWAGEWRPGKVTVIKARSRDDAPAREAHSAWAGVQSTIEVYPSRLCPMGQFVVNCLVPSTPEPSEALTLVIEQGGQRTEQRVVRTLTGENGWIQRIYSAMPEELTVGEATITLVGPNYSSEPATVRCVPWLIPPTLTGVKPEFVHLSGERIVQLQGGPFLWDASLLKPVDELGPLEPYAFHIGRNAPRGLLEGQRSRGVGRIPFHLVYLRQGRRETVLVVRAQIMMGTVLPVRLPADLGLGPLTLEVRTGWLEVDQDGTVVREVLSDNGIPTSVWIRI